MSGASDILSRRVDDFEVQEDSISACANQLRRLGIRVCSFEELPRDQGASLRLRDATVAQILDAISARNPGYRWDEAAPGLINVFPSECVLQRPVPEPGAWSKPAWLLLEEDLNIASHGIVLFNEFGDPDGPPVSLGSPVRDLRDALNAIVRQWFPMVWHIAGQPGAYHLSFTLVTTDASPDDGLG